MIQVGKYKRYLFFVGVDADTGKKMYSIVPEPKTEDDKIKGVKFEEVK